MISDSLNDLHSLIKNLSLASAPEDAEEIFDDLATLEVLLPQKNQTISTLRLALINKNLL